ncbi:DUF4422 domain-containing protein [Chryseobacterium sp. FH1]|uniref:DUF4422 domain-containing protein n=1 Tax=Chryseobacterium sp. FH1 TaxID=1233951 RepID=UPI0004E3E3F2|nr:DUF4422 domain-containing protein [Chryseobacterium sp. FH1]KFC20004.1 hypothetical protein IO90_12375 [Chryseobacterium sp. FH1]
MNLKILVCCLKDDLKVENEYYLPIHVGKKTSDKNLQMTGDDTGDNISLKNPNYCELTGIYWAWKNLKNVDYIGLCHYRRYFNFDNALFSSPSKRLGTENFKKSEFNISDKVKDSLKKGNVIVPISESFRVSLYIDYCVRHYSEDLRFLEKVIKKQDTKYSNAFDKIMYENNELYPYNMFIMSWQEFDKYCTWLFPILEEIEQSIDISKYDFYQKRIYGFMAERLFNIYVEANQLKVDERQVLFVSDDNYKVLPYLFFEAKRIFNKLVSKLASPPRKFFSNK